MYRVSCERANERVYQTNSDSDRGAGKSGGCGNRVDKKVTREWEFASIEDDREMMVSSNQHLDGRCSSLAQEKKFKPPREGT